MTQKPIDRLNFRRRVFETPAQQTAARYIVKRTVPSAEQEVGSTHFWHDPRDADMLRNEIKAIEYVRSHTTIPVPVVVTSFSDRNSVYMIQEYVEGTVNAGGTRLDPAAQDKIRAQLKGYIDQLHALTDLSFRSFVGAPFLPARLYRSRLPLEEANYPPATPSQPYVLCHGDLGWQNILIDPQTYEIKCIIDWEYAGFYPVELEGDLWQRQDPALGVPPPMSDVETTISALVKLAARDEQPSERRMVTAHMEDDQDEVEEDTMDQTTAPPLTDSQLRLRKLNIGFPPDRPISAASLATQTTIAAHIEIANDLDAIMAIGGDTARSTTDLWVRLQDAKRSRPRDIDIHGLWERYTPLRDRLCDFKLKPTVWTGEGAGKVTPEEAKKTEETRIIADKAYKDAEVIKWEARRKFAESLLRLSTAAQSLIPFLPDETTTPLTRWKDRDRHIAEQRAADIISSGAGSTGGTGGWRVVVEVDEEEYERIKSKYGREWDEARDKDRETEVWLAEERVKREERAMEMLELEHRRRRELAEQRQREWDLMGKKERRKEIKRMETAARASVGQEKSRSCCIS